LRSCYPGPSFTHPAIPFRAHHFGAATPRNDPTRYLSLVTDLLSAYRLSVQYPPYASTHSAFEASAQDDTKDNRSTAVVPLVINTQGWVKGLGMDLLVKIEQAAEATDVFEFEVVPNGDEWEEGGWEASIPSEGGWGRIYEEPNEEDDQPYGQSTSSARRHLLTPIPPTPLAARWTAYDLRILSLISYFHCRFPAQRLTIDNAGAHASPLATTWDFSLPLVAHRPWAVDWTVAFREIHLVGPGSEEIIPSLIWDALAVGLVALVAPDERESGATTARIDGVPYVQGRPPPSPSTTRLLGFGIVRSPPGDEPLHDKLLHLLTPLPARLLPEATVLVKGETEVPLQAMLDWTQDDSNAGVAGVEREHVPYIEWTGKAGGVGVVGGARRKVRRNVGRRQG
jgi:polynucleotide 5'-hydroxyl-kinase GRC3/NOL9